MRPKQHENISDHNFSDKMEEALQLQISKYDLVFQMQFKKFCYRT
ncbi:hypothetical protein PE36_01210 [Moritella sp. PE36]|nr:hypothetical protein PE36_01210 [Moritella sp. PE36]